MRAGREIIAPQRIEQILVAGEGQLHVELLLVLALKGFGVNELLHLVHHARLRFLQRNVGQRRQRAGKISVDHHLPRRHLRRDLAQQIAPVRQARKGDRAHDHPFVFRRHRKEAVDELLGLGRVGSDRTGDEAEIDAGILRLLEGLRVKQHAHRRRDMAVIRLGAIIVDPLLHHAERGARIDLRRAPRRMSAGCQQEQRGTRATQRM